MNSQVASTVGDETIVDHLPWHTSSVEDSLDLEIGEVSRFVSFQDVLQPPLARPSSSPLEPADFLAPPLRRGVARGTCVEGFPKDPVLAEFREAFGDAVATEAPKRERRFPLALALATAGAFGGLLYLASPRFRQRTRNRWRNESVMTRASDVGLWVVCSCLLLLCVSNGLVALLARFFEY